MTDLFRMGCLLEIDKKYLKSITKNTKVTELGTASWIVKLYISIRTGKKTTPPPIPATVVRIVAQKRTNIPPISIGRTFGNNGLCSHFKFTQTSNSEQSESCSQEKIPEINVRKIRMWR